MALLAVAPLFLFPFCGEVWTARVLLWLTLFAAVWTFCEPSRIKDEMLHEARARVVSSIAHDPLFWVSLALAVFAAVRWLNGGVAMRYDADAAVWRLAPPAVDVLPGCVTGSGYLPFAVSLAVVVLLQACRHALGKSARSCFLFVAAVLAGVAGIVAVLACALGDRHVLSLVACSTEDSSYAGAAFALYFMGGLVALVAGFERKWKRALPLLAPTLGGCAVGAWLFEPAAALLVHAGCALLVLALALVYAQVRLSGLAVPKCLAFLVVMSAFPVLLVMGVVPESVKAAKLDVFFAEGSSLVPDSFFEMRALLSSIASKVFRAHPWIGTGLGSFALDIRFHATEADWSVLSSGQIGALNGWWQTLAERGVIGLVCLSLPLVFLVQTWVWRAVLAVKDAFASSHTVRNILLFHPLCGLGLVVVAATVFCGFFDRAFLRPEIIMATLAMFAMAGSAFPRREKKPDAEIKTEN